METISWFVLAAAFAFCFVRYLLRYEPAPDFMFAPPAPAGEGPHEEGGMAK